MKFSHAFSHLVVCLVLRAPRALAAGALGAVCACSVQVEAPTLTPKSLRVMGVTPQALKLQVEVEVSNPNPFPLIATEIAGDVSVEDLALGTGRATLNERIPAKGKSRVSGVVSVPWSNLAGLGARVLARGAQGVRSLPFTFAGKAKVGSKKLNTELPFEAHGALEPVQLLSLGLLGAK